MVMRPPPIKKCAGVRARCVIGLEFTAASILISVVLSYSSVRLDCPSTLRRQRFVVPTIRSHQPPPPSRSWCDKLPSHTVLGKELVGLVTGQSVPKLGKLQISSLERLRIV